MIDQVQTQQAATTQTLDQPPTIDWAGSCEDTLKRFAKLIEEVPPALKDDMQDVYERVQWGFTNAPVPLDLAYHNLAPGGGTSVIGKGGYP